MHMEYENVVLKRPTTGYEHGRKERLEIVQMVDGNSTLPAQQINVAEEPCQQLSLTGNGLYFTLCRTAVSMVKIHVLGRLGDSTNTPFMEKE